MELGGYIHYDYEKENDLTDAEYVKSLPKKVKKAICDDMDSRDFDSLFSIDSNEELEECFKHLDNDLDDCTVLMERIKDIVKDHIKKDEDIGISFSEFEEENYFKKGDFYRGYDYILTDDNIDTDKLIEDILKNKQDIDLDER